MIIRNLNFIFTECTYCQRTGNFNTPITNYGSHNDDIFFILTAHARHLPTKNILHGAIGDEWQNNTPK